MTYYITEIERNRLQNASKEFYPFEICGIIGLKKNNDHYFLSTLFIKNRAINQRKNFKLKKEEIEKGKKVFYDKKIIFIGYFHSHPSTYAIPTSNDRNFDIGNSLWLIQSVCYEELKLFQWNGRVFTQCELVFIKN